MRRLLLCVLLLIPHAAAAQDGDDDVDWGEGKGQDDETEGEGEPEGEAESDPKAESEAESDPEADPEADPEVESEADPESEANRESEAEGDPDIGELEDREYEEGEDEGDTRIKRSYYESGPDRDVLLPQTIGGLYVVPLKADEDLSVFLEALEIPADTGAVLIDGQPEDRFAFDGIKLKLPPPLMIFELETGVHVVAITRDAFTHEHQVQCVEGEVAIVLVDQVLGGLRTVDEASEERQRELMIELFTAIGDTEEIVEKIRICRRFLEIHPVGDAADKAQAILADLESKVTHEDEGQLDLSDNESTEELIRQRKLAQFAGAPRPPGAASRQVGGFVLLGGALGCSVGAVIFDQTAATAADDYHHELVYGTDASAQPYLRQARQNTTGFKLTLTGAIALGTTAIAILVADRAVHARWKRLREELGIEKEDDGEVMVVPTAMPLPNGGVGIGVGGVWR